LGSEGSSPDLKDLTSTSFGYIIAFLLPGILGLYALTFWSPQIGALFQPIFNGDAAIGPSAIFLLLALGMGVSVSAVRFVIFEKGVCRKHQLSPKMFEVLAAENKLASFKAAVDEHYRYHQFYGGCVISFPILFVGWWQMHGWEFTTRLVIGGVGFIIVGLLFAYSASDCFKKYVRRANLIVGGFEERGRVSTERERH